MEGALLLAIFWAAVYLGNKIDNIMEDQKRAYKDLATGICHIIDELKKKE